MNRARGFVARDSSFILHHSSVSFHPRLNWRGRGDSLRGMNTPRKMIVLTDGYTDWHAAKTAICVIRYRPEEVVAVLDREGAGKTCQEVLGLGGDDPGGRLAGRRARRPTRC